MAVVLMYVVEHKGVEKLSTRDKKEADLYDKMLDTADQLSAFLSHVGVQADEALMENISILLSKNKDAVTQLLRGKSFEDIKAEIQKVNEKQEQSAS